MDKSSQNEASLDQNTKPSSFIQSWTRRILERVSGVHSLWDLYDQMEQREKPEGFVAEVLQLLQIKIKLDEKELERITSSGPVVVVSNHPHGALDGIMLAHILLSVRKDVKFMANPILAAIQELKDLFFFIEPYQDLASRKKNIRTTRSSINWLKSGGLLALFPSGEVSHMTWKKFKVKDPPWNENVAKIIRKSKATIVPIHISGENSLFFQLVGLIHSKLRTLLLPRELINKKRKEIEVRIGKPIPFERLPTELSNQDLVKYFRFRSGLLNKSENFHEERKISKIKAVLPSKRKRRIAPHEGTRLLSQEVEQLPEEQVLLKTSSNSVYIATADQAPHLLNEIGRLREKTFRRVGEGTGQSRDLDEFDQYYLHLFVWNEVSKEIVGAYRVGKTDEIIQKHGVNGLYTYRLFDFGEHFIDTINPGLELGRSFIRPKYQKALTSLSLLWKGIGQFIHRNPHYRYLFGPVSISNDYSIISKHLIVDFIRETSFDAEISQTVQGRTPFEGSRKNTVDLSKIRGFVKEMDDLSDLVNDLEHGFDGVPILLRHYLRLGGKLLAFNVDKNFANALDGLIRVDLVEGNKRMIQNYMGKSEYESYRKYHEAPSKSEKDPKVANLEEKRSELAQKKS